jgi:hypothetical protein
VITKPPTTGYQRLILFDSNGGCGCFDTVVLSLEEANPFRREVIRSSLEEANPFRREVIRSGSGEHKLLEVLGRPIQQSLLFVDTARSIMNSTSIINGSEKIKRMPLVIKGSVI